MSDNKNAADKSYSLAVIREVAAGDETFVETLIEAFRTEATEVISELKEALEEKKLDKINQLAHKIKPSLEQFEMKDLHQKALELEAIPRKSNWPEIQEKVKQFREELEEMKRELE
jgi:HPt (histidine-containing phosphotransfer) domain-containing protein